MAKEEGIASAVQLVEVAQYVPQAYVVQVQYPSAFDVLQQSTGFFIRQKVQWLEEIVGFEQGNKYKIYWKPENYPKRCPDDNDLKALAQNHVFTAKEESECCQRQCFKNHRSFRMDILDQRDGTKVAYMDRACRCTLNCEYFCCGCIINPDRMFIRDINGNTFNTIYQSRRNFSCSHWLDIYEGEMMEPSVGSQSHVLTIERPCCPIGQVCGPNCFCKEVQFPVHTGAGGEGSHAIGRIANIFPGINCKGCCTKADNYVIEYPQNLLVGHKLALMGAALLIDYRYFEEPDNNDNNNQNYGGPAMNDMSR